MIRLSLIQTSQNRRKEIARFIDSLNNQININFSELQLIFVDQEDNVDLFKSLNSSIEFNYIKSKHISLSCARNIALPFVKGNFVAFPDDDCWYEPNVLNSVLSHLEGGLDGVIGLGTDEYGVFTNSFPKDSQFLSFYNHCGAISYTIFLRYDPFISFNEDIGVGSPYKLSSGEETDYILHFMKRKRNFKIFFDNTIIIHHPLAKSDYFENEIKKMYYYSRGEGYLMKIHNYPAVILLSKFFRPLLGMFLNLLLFKLPRVKRSYNILKGRIEGYNYKIVKI